MTTTPTPAEALRAGIDLINGDLTGVEWKRACRDFIEQATAALAAAPQPMGCGYPCGYDCNGACFDWAAAPQPATPGQRMIRAAEEAVAIARGEAEPASVYPAAEHDWGKPVGKEVLPPYQTTPADREALMEVVAQAQVTWSPDATTSTAHIADALLARGLRLPGGETMAWAVVGEDGKPDPYRVYAHNRNPYVSSMENLAPVAIRVVEGGDDA